MSDAAERCAGCGAVVPRGDCWAIVTRLGASQLIVDAYAVQHPGAPSRRTIQSVAVHLISLFMQIERGADAARARDAIRAALAIAYRFVWLDPPSWDGALTITDVRDAAGARAWAESVWRAWAPHHDTVRAWAELAGLGSAATPLIG